MRLSVLLIACFIAWITHEWGDEKPLPDGWYWTTLRADTANCKAFADKRPTITSPRPISLKCTTAEPGYVAARFFFPVEKHRGKRVAIFAQIRTEDVSDNARLWLRIDKPNQMGVAGDNMEKRRLNGTSDWVTAVVRADVPADATNIVGGIALEGSGKISVASWFIQEIGTDIDIEPSALGAAK